MSDALQVPFVPRGYELLHRLGSGQTSHVFLAKSRRGKVALKLPREELQTRPILRRMFENEVQITLSLNHPHTVAAFEGHPTGPQAFLALEHCAGGTLDQLLLERGRLPFGQAVQLVMQVARGLSHSHIRQVLHRDVKPANVFLTAEGQAKLGDFGTGVFMTEESQERVGTAFYMAPEIFEGRPASVQSDIYSLGILAYEVIAGERPFVGDSYEDLMMAHLSGLPKSLRHQRDEVSSDLAKAVAQAMSRDASRRFQTVRAFVEAFRAAADLPDANGEVVTGRAGRRRSDADEAKEDERRRGGLFGLFRRKKD